MKGDLHISVNNVQNHNWVKHSIALQPQVRYFIVTDVIPIPKGPKSELF